MLCGLLALLCRASSAQAAPPPTADSAVPARPDWDWIRQYAARRFRAGMEAWPAQIQAAVRDANHLTAAQQTTLERNGDVVTQAIAGARQQLAAPLGLECPATLKAALQALQDGLEEFQRDAQPPWTQHNHFLDLMAMTGAAGALSWQLGCVGSAPARPAPPPVLPPSPYAATLSGTAVDAATGAPLANARVYLSGIGNWQGSREFDMPAGRAFLDEDLANRSVARETTAGAGWSFADVPPGCYTVTAYADGFLPARALVDVPSNMSHDCVGAPTGANSVVASRLHDVRLAARNAAVAEMPWGPLVAAYPLYMSGLRIGAARLSPDGRFLAFEYTESAAGRANLGLPEIWLYGLETHALKSLGSLPLGTRQNAAEDLAWMGDELAVRMIDPRGQLAAPPYQADTSGMHPYTGSAAAFAGAFAPRALDFISGARGNGRFTVSVESLGHGSHQLTMQTVAGASRTLVDDGGWQLDSAMFDIRRSLVYYPTFLSDPGAIVTVDLVAGQTQRRELPQRADSILDAVRLSTGVLIAYVVNAGDCNRPSSLGENRHMADLAARGEFAHVCFVTLPQ